VSVNPLMKPSGARTVVIIAAIALAIAGLGSFMALNPPGGKPKADASQSAQSDSKDPVGGIGALGRLEPEGEVFKVAPPAVGFSSRVAKVLVKEGDRVKVGQPIAVMDSYPSQQMAVEQARAQGLEAEAKLAQVKAGSKLGDVNAQKAAILQAQTSLSQTQAEAAQAELGWESAKAELDKRMWDLKKAETLCQIDKPIISEADNIAKGVTTVCKNGAISETEVRSRVLAVVTQQKQVEQAGKVVEQRRQAAERAGIEIAAAGQRLDSVSEVRPTDIQQAETQIQIALANYKKAQVDLENAIVKSPIDGQVLKIYTKENESVGTKGLLELGRTSQMYAVAEVDENLISRVKPGQRAIVKSDAFVGEITGKVDRIGNKVGKNEITSTDPADAQDVRVVEVRIKLDNSELVAGLTNLQVKVAIQP
jgi:HlyD family secretion protein